MNDKKILAFHQKFTEFFDGKDEVRESALKIARKISRRSTKIIRKLHSKNKYELSELLIELNEIKAEYKKLKDTLKSYPELYFSNMVENYVQEYVEATIMITLLKNNLKINTIPDPDKMGVRYSTYLMGLGDVIGEFRRCTLDAIRTEDLTMAAKYMDTMEQLNEIIIDLNYPDGVLPLRRKQDIARSLIEKTRGDLAFAVSEYSLKENINELKIDLKKYYKNVVRKH